jgi:hypothetical protein
MDGEEVDPDTIFDNHECLMRGLRAIGSIKRMGATQWQHDVSQDGQLIDSTGKVNILVWADPGNGRMAISRTVELWSRDLPGKKPLLVLAEGNGGEFEMEGMVKATPEGDISSSREADTGDPRAICNKAYLLRMERIENPLEEPDFIAALAGELEQPLRELTE